MPPPPETPLNPVNNPAYSPSFTVESSLFSAGETYINYDAMSKELASETVTRMPSQSPSSLKPLPRRPSRPNFESTKSVDAILARTKIQPVTASLAHATTTKVSAPVSSLPYLPEWSMHVFAGAMSFMVVVAIALFIAQFPPRVGWVSKMMKWKKESEYERLGQNDDDGEDFTFDPAYGTRSTVASAHDKFESGGRANSNSLRRRRRKNLSIDTALASRGSRIGKPAYQTELESASECRSYDEEALRIRPKSPVIVAWESFAAPLPSAPTFKHSETPVESYDVETGLLPPSSTDIPTPDIFDTTSRYHQDVNEEALGSDLLNRINGSIYSVADKLSRTFYEQMKEPEEGLLLPVHSAEREKPGVSGVFAE